MLLAVVVVSSLLVVYLIWSGGGFVEPAPVVPTHGDVGTDQILVRAPTRADIDAILQLSAQPHSMAMNGWSAQTLQDYETSLRAPGELHDKGCFVLAVEPSGTVTGYTSLSVRPGTKDELSIGINIDQNATGKGVGTALMRFSITTLQEADDRLVWVGTATDNVGVQKIMERLGYSPEPGIVPYEAPNGQSFPSVWYEVGRGTRAPR